MSVDESAALVGKIREEVTRDSSAYGSDASCLDLLWRLRFSDNGRDAPCPRCGVRRRFHRIRRRPSYSCDACGHHIHPTADTLFHKSSTPLSAWFTAIRRISEDPAIPATALKDELGVTYKTAWRMANRLRPLLNPPSAEDDGTPRAVRNPEDVFGERRSRAPFDERADAIVTAAARAIAKRGFAATRMADIAAEAGTSPGTVHYYFPHKADVLIEALKTTSRRPLERLREVLTEDSDVVSRLAKLLQLAVPYGSLREEYVLWLEFWTLVTQKPELLGEAEEMAAVTREPYLRIIEQGAEEGVFTLRAPGDEVAERLMAVVDALAFKTIVGYRWMSPDRMRELLLRFAAQELDVPFEELDRHALASDLPA
jgi:AcrR family transcriptional regulator/predicted RNA-binding Zn-ribbon protein involved in translation (DUF1610 family)